MIVEDNIGNEIFSKSGAKPCRVKGTNRYQRLLKDLKVQNKHPNIKGIVCHLFCTEYSYQQFEYLTLHEVKLFEHVGRGLQPLSVTVLYQEINLERIYSMQYRLGSFIRLLLYKAKIMSQKCKGLLTSGLKVVDRKRMTMPDLWICQTDLMDVAKVYNCERNALF